MDTLLPLDRQSLPAGMDARALLREARAQVEALACERWTDYNTHDPGITILEQLVYALTDLGLRSRLDIADYLAGVKDPFFAARAVLPNAAGTITDFRRLLIDRPGVRNAWLEDTPGDIKGLFNLLLDLEPGAEAVDEVALTINRLRGRVLDRDFYVVFPTWEELPENWTGSTDLSGVTLPSIVDFNRPDDPDKTVYDQYYIKMTFSFGPFVHEPLHLWVRLLQGIHKSDTRNEKDFRLALRQYLHNNIVFFKTYQQRARLWKQRLAQMDGLLGDTAQFIRKHRNLGEDWGEIGTIRVQQIGVQLNGLELSPEADPVAVLARIYFLLEQFIDPRIRPFGFEQLRVQDLPAAEFFEGPLLENGFLPEDRLHPAERADAIYTSDLVRIVMEQPEVTGIGRLTLEHYMEQLHMATRVANCLNLRNPRLYKPKFSFEDSSALVTKQGVGLTPDREAVRNKWLALKAAYAQDLAANGDGDLPVPAGERLDIGAYYSVQNEFPQAYGLRAGEISKTAPLLRQAQAKQLKGYLCLFDQLLANHAAQLENLGQLFSADDAVQQTYFQQPQYQTPAVQEVLDAYLQALPGVSWADFQQQDNAYVKGLAAAAESPEQFRLRRNLFLDHLLARLGEDFSEYSAWAIARNGGSIPDDLLRVKQDFLKQAPELSGNRSVAFDYMDPNVWDTDNVSGYEKRVAALLGMVDCRRRTLSGNDAEGMHLIEHVLLRTVNDSTEDLVPPVLHAGDPFIKDAYSFQVSIFLPAWTSRFKEDPEFRALTERTLRRELPAHLYAWIYWVGEKGRETGSKFRAFEVAYKFWLENLHTAQWPAGQSKLINSINNLIASDEVTRTNQYALFEIPETT